MLLSLGTAIAVGVVARILLQSVESKSEDTFQEYQKKVRERLRERVQQRLEEEHLRADGRLSDVEAAVSELDDEPLRAYIIDEMVRRSAEDALADDAAVVEEEARAAFNRRAGERQRTITWLPIVLGVMTLLGVLGAAWISAAKNPPPDCSAFASTLLSIHRQAPTNDAAVAAATSLEWDSLDEKCGSPVDFIRPLGDPSGSG